MKRPWESGRPASPHKLLNAYVQRYVVLKHVDGNETILEGEEAPGPVLIGTFQWSRIENRKSYYSVGYDQLISL